MLEGENMKQKIVVLSFTLLTCVGFFAGPAFAGTYMVYDEWGGTWYDSDITSNSSMAWAASASNALAWTGWGFPPGESFTNEDDIFEYFRDHWTERAGNVESAWQWMFDGTEPSSGSQVYQPGGSFWQDYFNFDDYYYDWKFWDTFNGSGSLPAIDSFLHSGYGVAIQIYNGPSVCVLNVWGYETNDQGDYIGLFITDPTDGTDTLDYVSITTGAAGLWFIEDFQNSTGWDLWIGEVYGLDLDPPIPTPEPATMLLLGSGLLGLAGIRRKLRKS